VEIKFLGTGSGKTSLTRHHSSFLLSTGKLPDGKDSYNLLVDAGDGISRAFLQQKIPVDSIDGILLSHFHPDHYTGLASLIVQMKMEGRENKLELFAHESSISFLEEFIYQSYLFPGKLNFNLEFNAYKINDPFLAYNSFSITARQNNHLDSSIPYDIKRRLTFSCCSFLMKIEDKNIFYTGDIGSKNDLYIFQGYPIDIMISEITHISPDELLESFKKLNPKKLLITHISEEDENKLKDFHYQLTETDRKKIIQAFDGLEIKI
jgi:ribonuclease BN (tRNA processing enzyme)